MEAADNDGHTPLNYACKHSHLEVARLLLDAGADLFAASDDGKTVFDTARADLVNFLLQTYAAERQSSNPCHPTLCHLFVRLHGWQALSPSTGSFSLDELSTGKAHGGSLSKTAPVFPRQFIAQSRQQWGIAPSQCLSNGGSYRDCSPSCVAACCSPSHNDQQWRLALARCLPSCAAPSLDAIRFLAEQDLNAVQAPNSYGALPLHFLCGRKPQVQTVKYLLSLFEGALAMPTHQGHLPLMLACMPLACESVIRVLLMAYPDALIYMQEHYNSHAPDGAP